MLKKLSLTIRFLKKRKELYLARSLYNARNYPDLINQVELNLKERKLSPYVREELIYLLFNSYLKTENFRQAVLLYVDNYLLNPSYAIRLDEELLISELQDRNNSNVGDLIDLAILYNIANTSSYDQYVAYDIFTESNSLERPTELLSNCEEIDESKLVHFLKEVCTTDVLHHSLYFNGSDDIDSERLKILQELLKLDKDNESKYIEEITDIIQKTNIKKAIREVNKGRITVNISQLKSLESSNIRQGFNRYKELANYSKDKELTAVDSSSKMISEYLSNINEEYKKKIVHLNDPAFITFKVMFIEIRDEFILSKEYGLDGYLSTRIRHGALLNHIRSVFESLNLISQKNNKGDYLDNKYWDKKILAKLHHKRDDINYAIKKFSKKVDEYTEKITKELIQVKTEKYQKDSKALFDFTLDQNTLAVLFKRTRDDINDYDAFLDYAFDFLETLTKRRLEQIREYFNNTIKQEYNSLINDFGDEVRSIIGDTNFVDLTTSISKSSTDIQNELMNVSEWFKFSNPSQDLILSIEELVRSSLEITKNIYPNKNIKADLEINTDLHLTGPSCNHLIYIFRILLDNIIMHSGLPDKNNDLKAWIKVDLIKNKLLSISFRNKLSPNINQNKIEENLSKAKSNWEESTGEFEKINIEGGSGFDKIKRILAIDIGCQNYNFNFDINDSNELVINIDFDVKIQSSHQ